MRGRGEPRFRKRIPCQLGVSGTSYAGMVLNLSRGGLFVQTCAGVGPGDVIRVELKVPGSGSPIELDGQVVWKRVVAAQLRALTQGGLGLRIHAAPEAYFQLLLSVSDGGGMPGAAPR